MIVMLVLLFQNCSQMKFQPMMMGSKTSESGVPYGGKPKQDFYRFVPDFTCQNGSMSSAPAAVALLEVDGATATLTENKNVQCAATTKNLDPNLIDRSVFQNEVVGYQEGIFEGLDSTPTSIPANLVEVWCRDRKDQQGLETITHFDRQTNKAVNRIYFSSGPGQTQLIADFPVARVVGQNTVVVKDQNGFELTVYRDQPASEIGLFKGILTAVINGKSETRETSCRLGGSVDPQVWPNQQVVGLNVKKLKISPDRQYFSYVADQGTSLYISKIDGSNQMKLNSSLQDTLNFNFTADSKSLLFTADNSITARFNLMKVNIDGTAKVTLNPELTSTKESIPDDFKLTKDGLSVLYTNGEMGTTRSGSWDPLAKWLQIVPLAGGTPLFLNPIFRNTMVGVSNFDISDTKAVFLCCGDRSSAHPGGNPDLYSVNLDGTGLLKITPKTSTGEDSYYIGDYLKFAPGNSIVLSTKFAVAADGSGAVEIPTGWQLDLISPSGEFALLISDYKASATAELMSLKTGAVIALPNLNLQWTDNPGSNPTNEEWTLDSTFFTKDSNALIGKKILSSGKLQAISVSIATGVSKDLCPGITSQHMLIQETSLGTYLILTYDQDLKMLNVFKSAANSACVSINSVAISNPNLTKIRSVSLSPDGQKMIATLALAKVDTTLNGFPEYDKSSQLYYIPLNGRPAILINTPVYAAAAVSQSFFLADSKTVLFVGDQIRSGQTGVFKWTAPKP